jgi:uncharacterized protein (TIGR03437 family)
MFGQSGRGLEITQNSGSCIFSISPVAASFPWEGGTGSFTVTSVPGGCWWQGSSPYWVNVQPHLPLELGTPIAYTVATNLGGPLTGSIALTTDPPSGASLAISQAGLPGPTLSSINPSLGLPGTSVSVTLSGTNFAPGYTRVNTDNPGITVSGVNVPSETQLSATFTIAAGASGSANITVATPANISNAVSFSIGSGAVPTLSSMSPSSGVAGSSVGVTLRGTNFVVGATTVNTNSPDITVTNVNIASATQMTAVFTVAAVAPEIATVTVTTAQGTSNATTFTIVPGLPTLSSITPSSGMAGTSVNVTLSGTYFTAGALVTTDNPGITVTNVNTASTTQMSATFVIAAGASGTANITVVIPGAASNPKSFSIGPGAPMLSSISPSSGAAGSSVGVTLSGTNFVVGATAVNANNAGITVTNINVASTTKLSATFTIASGASGTGNITVTTSGGTSNTASFSISPGAPTLSSMSPSIRPVSSIGDVTLYGTNFVAGATTVNTDSAGITVTNVNVTSPTQLTATFTIAASASGTANVTVTTAFGTSNATSLKIVPAPTLSSISPSSGAAGGSLVVTLSGTNFMVGATSVYCSNAGVSVTNVNVASTTQMSAVFAIAAGASGTANVTVATPAGSSNTASFGIVPGAPTLSSISPSSGAAGSSVGVTLSGTNFVVGATTVNANNAGISVTNVNVASATQLSAVFTIAAGASGTANVTVTTSGGTSNGTSFSIRPGVPTLSSISPSSGAAGSSVGVTLSGANFVAGATTVNANNAGLTVTNVNVASATQLSAVFTIAAGASGTASVTVTTSGGTSNTVTFGLAASGVTLSVSPSVLFFSSVSGGSAPSPQSLTVSSNPTGLSFSASLGSGCGWLLLSTPNGTTNGTTPASLSATASSTGLASGNYSCTISVSTPNATPVSVQANLAVTGTTLSATPGSLNFVYSSDSTALASQSFNVTSANPASGAAFQIVPGSGCGWLNVKANGTNTPARVTASVNTSGLIVNTSYNCTLSVTSPNASNTPQVTAALTVTPSALTVLPKTVSFNLPGGSTTPVGSSVSVIGPATPLSFTASASSGANWLSVSPSSGNTPLTLNLIANPSGLAPNTYSGTVTVSAGGAQQTVNVSLVVSNLPSLTAAPNPLSFRLQAGSAAPPSQTISVFASDSSAVSFTTSVNAAGGNWLNATKLAGQNVGVSVTPAALAPGQYSGTVTITSAPNTTNPSQQSVPVTLIVDPAPPSPTTPAVLGVSPGSLPFSFVQNGSPGSVSLTVSNLGGGTLTGNVTAGSLGKWLTVSPGTFSIGAGAQQILSVTADPTGLLPSAYIGQLTFTNSANGQQTVVPATATVAASNQNIQLSANALTFTALQNGPDPVPQTIEINNTGFGTMNFTTDLKTTTADSWLTPTSNTNNVVAGSPQMIQIGASNAGKLAPGDYFGTVFVRSSSAGNTPQIISVRLTVLPASNVIVPLVQPGGIILTSLGGAQQIQITNQGSSPVKYTTVATTNDGASWFTQSPASGTITNTGTITIQPQLGALAPGTYQGSLRILFANGTFPIVSVVGLVPGSSSSSVASGELQPRAATPCGPVGVTFTSPKAGQQIEAGKSFLVTVAVTDCHGAPVTGASVSLYSNGRAQLNNNNDGTYSNDWTFIEPPTGTQTPVSLLSTTAIAFVSTINDATIGVTVLPSTKSVPALQGIVNSGSYQSQGAVTPGNWVSLFGANLGDGPQTASSVPLNTQMANAQVSIGGEAVPLNFVSAGQINAQIPFDLTPDQTTQISITHGTEGSIAQTVQVLDALPAIFTTNQNGTGQGAIVDVNNAVVDGTNPVHAGNTIVIYCTGLGATNVSGGALGLGVVTPTPAPLTLSTPSVTIGGVPATVSFSGLSPGSVGLYQINAIVPAGVTPGASVPVVIAINSKASPNGVTIAIQ